MRYQRRPDVVEAIRWTGDNEEQITGFVGDHRRVFANQDRVLIPHTGGVATAVVGEWIVKDASGCLSVMTDPAFRAAWQGAPDQAYAKD